MKTRRSNNKGGFVVVPLMPDRRFLSIIPFPKLTIEGGLQGLITLVAVFALAIGLGLILGQLHP